LVQAAQELLLAKADTQPQKEQMVGIAYSGVIPLSAAERPELHTTRLATVLEIAVVPVEVVPDIITA
jgi:hypothetical protein